MTILFKELADVFIILDFRRHILAVGFIIKKDDVIFLVGRSSYRFTCDKQSSIRYRVRCSFGRFLLMVINCKSPSSFWWYPFLKRKKEMSIYKNDLIFEKCKQNVNIRILIGRYSKFVFIFSITTCAK